MEPPASRRPFKQKEKPRGVRTGLSDGERGWGILGGCPRPVGEMPSHAFRSNGLKEVGTVKFHGHRD